MNRENTWAAMLLGILIATTFASCYCTYPSYGYSYAPPPRHYRHYHYRYY